MMRRLLLFVLVALALPAGAGAGKAKGPVHHRVAPDKAPAGLHAFLLRADESSVHTFPRTPSFAWKPIRQRGTYQFQLSMSRTFDDSQILYTANVAVPALAVPLQLPWMTGHPYALWAHVRFKGKDGRTTPWSAPFGFNMRWSATDVPRQLAAPVGLVRWSPVDGATAYEVFYPDLKGERSFFTTTNVADEREFWTFHQSVGLAATIHWRVRAVRYIDAQHPLRNGLPAVSYGPWSPTFTTVNPPSALVAGPLTPEATVSDSYDRLGQAAKPHDLMPGFAWNGSQAVPGLQVGSPLYRVYISTDNRCVNTVFVGPIVGSPAYAPRINGGPFALPQNMKDVATWQSGVFKNGGPEGQVFGATGDPIVTNEEPSKPVGGSSASASSSTAQATTLDGKPVAHVDLWDSGWPNGRYYWTVVPVEVQYTPSFSDSKPTDSSPIYYQDAAVPQDACQSGRTMSFGKVTQPVVTASSGPYASGLSPTGRMVAAARAKPHFYSTPLVAWLPAVGAQTYQIQWSKRRYPWAAAGSVDTPSTSVVLPITKPGTWYYRVRGINPSLPAGAQNMTWSAPVGITITGNVWHVVK